MMDIESISEEIAALAAFGAFDGARLLEVGCGDGRLTASLAARVPRLVGIDPSPIKTSSAATCSPTTACPGTPRWKPAFSGSWAPRPKIGRWCSKTNYPSTV